MAAVIRPGRRFAASWRGAVSARLEAAKWLGLIAMLVDHVNRVVFAGAEPRAEFIGSLAFPLFAFALAGALSMRPAQVVDRTILRLVWFGLAAQVFFGYLFGWLPFNILFTFALGVGLYRCVQFGQGEVAYVAAIVIASIFVEYSTAGVLFVALLLFAFRSQRHELVVLPLLLMPAFYWFNSGNHWALIAPVLVVFLLALPADLPRIRGAFYWAYLLQWPALLVGREFLS